MENNNQRSSLLTWAYFCQGKTFEELRHSLLYTTLELEQTKMLAQEEIRKRDDQIIQLKDLLNKTIKERDEAQERCQTFLLEKILIQQQGVAPAPPAPLSGMSSIEDEPRRGIDSTHGFSSSDCEESIVSSPIQQQPPPLATMELVPEKQLPEKGKLLQAVMKAGPLLQTLLLAGPLPQWRHPPPPLESFEIPPVTITTSPSQPQLLHQETMITTTNSNSCSEVNRKRVFCDGIEYPTEAKFQRVILH